MERVIACKGVLKCGGSIRKYTVVRKQPYDRGAGVIGIDIKVRNGTQ